MPTPIYLDLDDPFTLNLFGNASPGRHRLVVPHFSDTFTKTLFIPREWFVNEDRSKALGKFVLKPLQLELQPSEFRDVAVIVKDVENGGATSLGSLYSHELGTKQRHRAGAAYCERTKDDVFREWQSQ